MSIVYYTSLIYSISILIIKLNSTRNFFFQPQKQYRQYQKRKYRRRYHTADDNPRHAHARLRACAQRKRCRQHAHHHRQCCHKDRLQTRFACLNYRSLRRHAFMHQRQRIVQKQRAVFATRPSITRMPIREYRLMVLCVNSRQKMAPIMPSGSENIRINGVNTDS